MEVARNFEALASITDLLEPTANMDLESSYEPLLDPWILGANCNPSCGSFKHSGTYHSPSCENFGSNPSYESFRSLDTFLIPSGEAVNNDDEKKYGCPSSESPKSNRVYDPSPGEFYGKITRERRNSSLSNSFSSSMYSSPSFKNYQYVPHNDEYSSQYDEVCSPKYEVCSPKYEVCSPKYEVCSPKYEVCSPKYAVCSPKYNICSPKYEVCSQNYELSSPQYEDYSSQYTSQTPQYEKHSSQYINHKPNYENHNHQYVNQNLQYSNKPHEPTDSLYHKPVRKSHLSETNPDSFLFDCSSSSFLNATSVARKSNINKASLKFSREISLPKSTSQLPSVLPTPPQSPPTSGVEEDLEKLLKAIPEIIEDVPPSRKEAMRGFDDILRDLHTTVIGFCDTLKRPPPTVSPLSEKGAICTSQDDFLSIDSESPIKTDSMLVADLTLNRTKNSKAKIRSFSESSDEQDYSSNYSDEEFGPLPDTPCVSDEDIGRGAYNDSSPCPSSPAASVELASSPSFASSVNSDHDYCGKGPKQESRQSKLSDTEDEIDVILENEMTKVLSPYPHRFSSTFVPSSPAAKTTSSNQVKRQLQQILQESIKNKQKKGRVGRPPKSCPRTVLTLKPTFPVFEDSLEAASSAPKGRTIGKPDSYTKRMREQHHEVLKTNKKRKTLAKDPEDDHEKRSNHNIMERNRRVNIKNLFDGLRLLVPDIQENERASKVLILKKSKEYIKQLQLSASQIEHEKTTLTHRQQFLKKKLQALRMTHTAQ